MRTAFIQTLCKLAGRKPSVQNRTLTALLSIILLAIGIYLIRYFSDYGNWFIHPHQFEGHLPALLSGEPGLHLSSFAKIFHPLFDQRPRFLSYAIILLNLHLRMWLYQWLVLFPPFSLGWIFELIAGPYLLYLLLMNLTKDRVAVLAGLLVYMTSIGFLCGFAMPLMPGKPLTNVIFLATLYILSVAKKRMRPGQLFHEVAGGPVLAASLGAVLLAGLFLDEVPLFAFLLPFLFFPELFFPRTLSRADLITAARAMAPLSAAALIFVLVAVVIVPRVTESLYGYHFDFFGTVEGRYAHYAKYVENLLPNFFSFFGLSTVPATLAPLLKHPSGNGVVTGQEANWIVVCVTLAAWTGLVYLAYARSSAQAVFLRRTILATLLFVLFMSALSNFHVPFISGYVYGCGMAVFLALLAGFAQTLTQRVWSRRLVTGLIVGIALIQLFNFNAINRSWIEYHNERWTRPAHENELPIAQDGRHTTRAELWNIWKAWKVGQLDVYLHDNQISSGAVFLIFELRYLDDSQNAVSKPVG